MCVRVSHPDCSDMSSEIRALLAAMASRGGSESRDPPASAAFQQRIVSPDVIRLEPSTDYSQPKPAGALRVVCISDTHARHHRMALRDIPIGEEDQLSTIPGMTLGVPDGDILIHAGDFTNVGMPSDVRSFSDFLGMLPHRYKIVIAGNHDIPFDKANYAEKLYHEFHAKRGLKEPLDVEATTALLQVRALCHTANAANQCASARGLDEPLVVAHRIVSILRTKKSRSKVFACMARLGSPSSAIGPSIFLVERCVYIFHSHIGTRDIG